MKNDVIAQEGVVIPIESQAYYPYLSHLIGKISYTFLGYAVHIGCRTVCHNIFNTEEKLLPFTI